VSPIHIRSRVPIRPALAVLCAALCVLVAACKGNNGDNVVRVVPTPPWQADAAAPAPAPGPLSDTGDARPRIAIDPQYTVLQILNVNLDQDPDEEQVIAVKRLAEVGAPVRLLVVDADPSKGTYYFQSWDTDTDATDSRVFSVSARDIVGDHSLQLVASGMNEAGKLTLDVYRLLPPSQGKGLVYRPVLQVVADEVTVDESERPDSYPTDPKPGASFPVTAYLRDPDSQNVMDLVRIRYGWNAAENRYVPGAAEKIPGEEVRQAQLKALFTSSGEQAFEQFISGSWVQVQPGIPGKTRDTYVSIIDFDPVSRKIGLSSGNTQEVYLWRESHRTIYNRLLAIGENETVLQIQLLRTFSITVNDPANITVTIIGNDTGESPTVAYTRVDDAIRSKLIDRPDAQVVLAPLSISGRYLGKQGLTVDFQSPRVSWRDGTGLHTGSYVVFSLAGRTILSTRFGGEPGDPGQITSWLVDYSERKDAVSVTRSLNLSPVQLTVSGFEEANGDTLSLLQALDLGKN
jgi:hypothetical protein